MQERTGYVHTYVKKAYLDKLLEYGKGKQNLGIETLIDIAEKKIVQVIVNTVVELEGGD